MHAGFALHLGCPYHALPTFSILFQEPCILGHSACFLIHSKPFQATLLAFIWANMLALHHQACCDHQGTFESFSSAKLSGCFLQEPHVASEAACRDGRLLDSLLPGPKRGLCFDSLADSVPWMLFCLCLGKLGIIVDSHPWGTPWLTCFPSPGCYCMFSSWDSFTAEMAQQGTCSRL